MAIDVYADRDQIDLLIEGIRAVLKSYDVARLNRVEMSRPPEPTEYSAGAIHAEFMPGRSTTITFYFDHPTFDPDPGYGL